MVVSFALTAGLSYSEAQELEPGLIFDLFLLRRKYDDVQHGIKRGD